jgi:hypothetical protein
MAVIKDHVNVQAILQTAVATRTSFSTQLLLVDDDQIPVDLRRIFVTPTDYDTVLTSSTVPYNYSSVFFAQKRVPTRLMLGRWAKVATASFFVCGTYETNYLTWKAVTDGSFRVTDGTNDDDLTAIDFSGATDFAGVVTVLNAKLAALVGPAITGLDTAEFAVDSQDRLVLTHSVTGASAPTLTIEAVAPASGTDLAAAAFFDAANGSTENGLDAEEPTDALTAISQIDDTYYNVHIRGESTSQATALATYIETKTKLLDLVVTDATAKGASDTTSVGAVIFAASQKRTLCIYTEKTTEYPDAAVAGCVLPASEGTTSWAYEVLASVTDSGLTKPLTTTERANLAVNNYNWIETIGSNTFLYDGITAGGEEKRVMLGRDWFVARISEDIFTYQLQQPLAAFDNPTLTAVEGIIWEWIYEGIARKLFINTTDQPASVTIPDADSFSAAEKATHTLTVNDAFIVYLNSAVNDYVIVGTLTL